MISVLIFFPIIAGLLAVFLDEKYLKIYSVVCSFLVFMLSLILYIYANKGYEFVSLYNLIPMLNINYYVSFDGINSLLSLLICFMMFISFLSLGSLDKTSVSTMLAGTGCAVGLFASRDMILFYTFWDLSLLPLVFLNARRGFVKISYKFFFYAFLGALLMLFGICIIEAHIYLTSARFDFSFEAFESVYLISDFYRNLSFVLFFIAFAIKTPLFPFHTWAPSMYSRANGISSVMITSFKMAPFGFYMFMLGVFKAPMVQSYVFLASLCIFSAIYSSFLAYKSTHLKEIITYSSIVHVSVILLGLFSLDEISVTGAVFYMFAHGVITGVLFILCDELFLKTKTYDINQMSNIAKKLPLFSFFFALFLFASISLPLTAGFIGEFLVLIGVFKYNAVFGVMATSMIVFNAIYMLNMFRNVFFKDKQNCVIVDTKLRKGFVIGICIASFVSIYLSLFPNYMLNNIKAHINNPLHYKMIKDKQ